MTANEPQWRQRLAADMNAAARELMGPGCVPSYYQQLADDFMPAVETAIAEATANAAEVAIATFREALARHFENGAESPIGGPAGQMIARVLAQTVREFWMED